jgi:hypothetical protein
VFLISSLHRDQQVFAGYANPIFPGDTSVWWISLSHTSVRMRRTVSQRSPNYSPAISFNSESMTTTLSPTSLVTYVTMRLAINGENFSVAQMGPDFIILEDRQLALPPCDAEVILELDGVPPHFQFRLPEGVPAARRRTPVAAR